MSATDPSIVAVIQGPVTSVGRTYRTTQLGRTVSDESKLVITVDCTANILEHTSRFMDRGVKVVYSGWSNDCPGNLRQELEGKGVRVVLSDPSAAPSATFAERSFKVILDNRAKQYYSLYQALETVTERDKKIAIKFRSDIAIDVDRLLHEVQTHLPALMAGGVLVQHMSEEQGSKRPSLYLPEFWFAGRADVLHEMAKDLLDRSLTGRVYGPNAHFDVAYAIVHYHWPFLNRLERKPAALKSLAVKGNVAGMGRELLRRLGGPLSRHKLASLYRNNLLIPASRATQHSMRWRGDSYGEYARLDPHADDGIIYGAGS